MYTDTRLRTLLVPLLIELSNTLSFLGRETLDPLMRIAVHHISSHSRHHSLGFGDELAVEDLGDLIEAGPLWAELLRKLFASLRRSNVESEYLSSITGLVRDIC